MKHPEMDLKGEAEGSIGSQLFWNMGSVVRKMLFAVLAVGPIPEHIAFIMDGNRRYAKKMSLTEGGGHNAGFLAVIRMLKYCYELGVKYVTVYAFSIDNYKRKPQEVQLLMNLMQIKMEEMVEVEGLAHQLGVRVYFSGNLKLLSDPVQKAVDKVMTETAKNTKAVLSVCVAYTSTDEITHSVQECCDDVLQDRGQKPSSYSLANGNNGYSGNGLAKRGAGGGIVSLEGIERNMYMAVAPEPEILVRTSGETRLSNFLLWQSGGTLLYSPVALWPEIGLWQVVWAVLAYQRCSSYLDKLRKRL